MRSRLPVRRRRRFRDFFAESPSVCSAADWALGLSEGSLLAAGCAASGAGSVTFWDGVSPVGELAFSASPAGWAAATGVRAAVGSSSFVGEATSAKTMSKSDALTTLTTTACSLRGRDNWLGSLLSTGPLVDGPTTGLMVSISGCSSGFCSICILFSGPALPPAVSGQQRATAVVGKLCYVCCGPDLPHSTHARSNRKPNGVGGGDREVVS